MVIDRANKFTKAVLKATIMHHECMRTRIMFIETGGNEEY